MTIRRRGLLAALPLLPAAASAQTGATGWNPDKPIRMLVGFSAGGSTDTTARIIAQAISPGLGQQVVVENRTGAGGNVASEAAARSAPDGYTVVMGSMGTHTANQALYKDLPFHVVNDFAAVSLVAMSYALLVVHPSVPVKTVPELIAYAKANPGKLSFGSPGIGSAVHISGEMFKLATGVDMVHVPYRGGGPASADLVAGNIQLMFGNASSTLPHVRAGSVRPLAVTAGRRVPFLPDLPTIAETAVPGFDIVEWYAFFGPAGIPPGIVRRLNEAIMAIAGTPEGRARLQEMGALVTGGTPEEFGAFLRGEVEKIGRVVREARISAE